MHIIGHQKERARLQRIAEGNTISQSYLFFGPESVGKSLCAEAFAYQLVGEPDFEPSTGKPYPFDVSLVEPVTETKRGVTKQKSISALTMRDALSFLGSFPSAGRFRVVIVKDAHKLSLSAQNVLLKTLEEPKSSAVIILVTHDIGSIIPTILSRIERVRFGYVPQEEIEKGVRPLISSGVAPTVAAFFFALGRPGMVLSAMDDTEQFAKEREKLGRLFRLSALMLNDRMKLAEELSKNIPETVQLIEWWLPGLHTQALKYTDARSTRRFFGLLDRVEQTLTLLKTTQSNARLLLEKLFFSL